MIPIVDADDVAQASAASALPQARGKMAAQHY